VTSEDRPGVDRRTLLKTLGASTAASLAGCSNLTSRYYAAVSVVLSEETQTALGYEHVGRKRMIEEREPSVGPLDADVVAESYLFSYSTDGAGELSTVWPRSESPPIGILSTPLVEELGQALNPLATTPLKELLALVDEMVCRPEGLADG
jgi:hypothetical protein